MQPVIRFPWDAPEYADAFTTLLSCTEERVHMHRILRGIFTGYPEGSRAIDWGAGTGDLTTLMLEHFAHVYAVEPHPRLRAVLAGRCPGARILDGTLISASPPERVEVGVISHVFYHIPDHEWGAYTIHAANQLSHDGVLVVTLKDPDSGCNRMLKHFGAPHYDLYAGLAGAMRCIRSSTSPLRTCRLPLPQTRLRTRSRLPGSCCVTGQPTPSPAHRPRTSSRSTCAGTSGMNAQALVAGS